MTPTPDRPWPFRAAVAGWLAAGALGVWLLPDVGRAGAVVLCGLWLAGLGIFFRDVIASLFGPVLAYDAIRVGRKRRTFIDRCLYASAMAIVLTWIYLTWYETAFRSGRRVNPADLARLAGTFFTTYMMIQFVLVCLLTPGSVANSITDEKERRTLEFLLATDLRDREILFGKFASRVGSMLIFLMAGLPVLAVVQFFGGIDPDQVVAGFAATFFTVLSLSAVAMAASVLSRKSRDAIALTYLIGIAYVCLSGVLMGLGLAATAAGETLVIGNWVIGWDDVAYPVACGNPFFMVPYLLERRGGATPGMLLSGTLHYLMFHLIVFATFIAWSGWRLRPIALAQTFGGPKRRGRLFGRKTRAAARRPDMGDSPVLWKEVFIESGFRMGVVARLIVGVLVLASFAPVGVMAFDAFIMRPSRSPDIGWWTAARWDYFGDSVNVYVRVLSPVVSSMLFLATTIRGAGVVLTERDRHTLDVLLTTPLSATRILWGKWWGCLLGMRWAWAWLGGIWLLGLACGGVSPIMVPALAISAAVYAAGFAWIGVFCSVVMKNSLRATVAALAISLFVGGGYFLVFVFCCILPLATGGGRGQDFDIFVDFLTGFCPPACLAWLPLHNFTPRELSLTHREIPFAPFWVLGLIVWGAFGWAMAQASLTRFRQLANRGPKTRRAAPFEEPAREEE